MGDRKWENLPRDCLVGIFSRVGVVSLVEDVSYVCKSWYEATSSPLCWKSLVFPHFLETNLGERYDDLEMCRNYYNKSFIKVVIRRSHGSANDVVFPQYFEMTQDLLSCVGEGCPSLKRLVLPTVYPAMLSSAICKWKNLESLEFGSSDSPQEVISEINVHCKNLVSLSISASDILENDAYAISTLLPNIEFLCLKRSLIERSSLMMILKGCRKLVHFEAGLWVLFDSDDEINSLAAGIAIFKFEIADFDSSTDYDYGYDDNSYNDFDYDSHHCKCRMW